jgi:hypothetical protein
MQPQSQYERFFHRLFVVISICLNLPALVVSVMGCLPWCDYFSLWLAANAALTAVNMLAAIYGVYRVQQASVLEEPPERPTGRQNNCKTCNNKSPRKDDGPNQIIDSPTDDESAKKQSSIVDCAEHHRTKTRRCCKILEHTPQSDRIRRLLRYDKLVSTYCVFFLFWVFWLSDGVERSEDINKADEELLENCSEDHEDHVQLSFILGFAYVACVVFSVIATFLPANS